LESYLTVATLWVEDQERLISGQSQYNDSFEGNDGSNNEDDFYTAEGFQDTIDKGKPEPTEELSLAYTRDKTTFRGPSL
jgi:hypothetical protein